MKRYRLNVSFGKYKPGQEISQEELAALCQNCAYIHEIPDTPEQTTKEGFVWDEIEKAIINAGYVGCFSENIKSKLFKASKQSQSNTPVFDAEKINQRIEQLAEMEEVFNAARERKYIKDPSIRTISDFTHDFQYKTFSEYLSSIKKQ